MRGHSHQPARAEKPRPETSSDAALSRRSMSLPHSVLPRYERADRGFDRSARALAGRRAGGAGADRARRSAGHHDAARPTCQPQPGVLAGALIRHSQRQRAARPAPMGRAGVTRPTRRRELRRKAGRTRVHPCAERQGVGIAGGCALAPVTTGDGASKRDIMADVRRPPGGMEEPFGGVDRCG